MKIILAIGALALLSACQAKQEVKPAEEQKTGNPAAAVTHGAASFATMPQNALEGAAAETAVVTRRDNFERIGKSMKILSREAKAPTPDMAAVKGAASEMLSSANNLPTWFVPGTAIGIGKSEAKPGIWEKTDDFTAKALAFRDAAQVTQTAADSGDAAAFKASMDKLGGSCKACHDPYRVKR